MTLGGRHRGHRLGARRRPGASASGGWSCAALRARGGDAAVGAQLGRRRPAGPARGGCPAGGRAGRPAGRGRLREPAGRPGGQPAAADRRRAPRRAGAGPRACRPLGGRCGPRRSTASRPSPGTSATHPRWRRCVEELEPLVRARGDAWLIQWVVFESAFVPAAYDRWDEARRPARPGPGPQPPQRLPGLRRLPPRLRGRGWPGSPETSTAPVASVAARSRPRPRWTTRGGTRGRPGCWRRPWSRRATGPRRRSWPGPGLATRRGTARPGRLLCAATLAAAHRRGDPRARPPRSPDVDCPPGRAWILGADAYLLLAGAAAERGDDEEAARLLEPAARRRRHRRGPPSGDGSTSWLRAPRAPCGRRAPPRRRAPGRSRRAAPGTATISSATRSG